MEHKQDLSSTLELQFRQYDIYSHNKHLDYANIYLY